MPQNFYELVWIFIIYAFIGWCTEVSYAALDRGIFVNRGFLNGPYCPIYGCGIIIVAAILTPLKENLLLLFIGSVILTTVLEYITGFVLEKVFHNKWWDYSDKPFNIHGYVCLKFSIYWGLACIFIMEIVHPVIYKCIKVVPFVVGVVILSIIMAAFVVDCVVTVSTILKFNRHLKLMNEMAEKIHKISDEIGENIYENVATAIEKSEEFQENHEGLISKLNDKKEDFMEIPGNAKAKITETAEAAKNKITETAEVTKQKFTESIMESKNESELRKEEKRKEREELKQKYNELLQKKSFGFKRLMKAFPDMKSNGRNESLEKYKSYFNIRRTKNSDTRKKRNEKEN